MGVGVALDVSLGKPGRPSWSWCFSLWTLEVFCAEELATSGGRDGNGSATWRSGVPGWKEGGSTAPVGEEGPGSELGRAGA